jgi:hypothetical protein
MGFTHIAIALSMSREKHATRGRCGEESNNYLEFGERYHNWKSKSASQASRPFPGNWISGVICWGVSVRAFSSGRRDSWADNDAGWTGLPKLNTNYTLKLRNT